MEHIRESDAGSAYRAELRLQRAAARVHELPARALYELLREIGVVHGVLDDIVERTQSYATLDPNILTAVGGEEFPPFLRSVEAAA